MGGFVVQYQAQLRDETGRFIAHYNAAEERAVAESVSDLADLARANAPRRSGQLAGSIEPVMLGAKQGVVIAGTDHAAPQEFGAGPHEIPNAFGWGITVDHPGNPATHFLKRAADAMRERFIRRVKDAFPG